MTRTAAVTGASGFIGRVLAGKLAGRGPLRGLFRRRTEQTRAWRDAGHRVVDGDLADDRALEALVDGADVVYHLAARTAKDDPEASHEVNVEGTRRLARVAGHAGVSRFVYASSISVYAATEPSDPGAAEVERASLREKGVQTITEEVEPRKVGLLNPYSATKYGGELAVRRLAERGQAPAYTVVRPTNVYGPGARAWFLDWAERLERRPVALGRDLPLDLVHVEDVARGLVAAAESEAAAGEVLHLGHESVAMADYLARLGEELGLRVRRLPRLLDRLVREAVTRGHRLLHDDRMSTPLTRRVRYPHGKALRLTGWEPAIRLEEGIPEMVRHREGDDGASPRRGGGSRTGGPSRGPAAGASEPAASGPSAP